MTYSLPIRGIDRRRKTWWDNFTKFTRYQRFGDGLNFKIIEWLEHRDSVLASYGASYDGSWIHFETEQAATFFILRWA